MEMFGWSCGNRLATLHIIQLASIMGKKRPCAKVDPKTGEIVHRYKSISLAAFRNGVLPASIQSALKGKCKVVGYEWIYDDDSEQPAS